MLRDQFKRICFFVVNMTQNASPSAAGLEKFKRRKTPSQTKIIANSPADNRQVEIQAEKNGATGRNRLAINCFKIKAHPVVKISSICYEATYAKVTLN